MLLMVPAVAFAQINLGSAASYAILAASTITSTGATTIAGDVGLSPGTAITGMPIGQPLPGTIHAADASSLQAQLDLGTAYTFVTGMTCTTPMTGVDLGGKTLLPGVYCFDTSAGLTGILNLNAAGDTAAVFVFQMGSTLTTAALSAVVLSNGAQANHVWWQIGSSATLGAGCAMQGSLLTHVSATLGAAATVNGRVLAQIGAITMSANAITGFGGVVTPTAKTSWGKVKAQYR
jgi:type VI secretion system secreted protein VgrG